MRQRIPRRYALLIALWAVAAVLASVAIQAFMSPEPSPADARVERMRPQAFDAFTAHEQAAVYRAICEAGFMPDLMRPMGLYPGFPSRKPFVECRAL